MSSWVPLGSTSGSATGSRKSEIGVQSSVIWIQPPIAASTVRTPTVQAIQTHGSVRSGLWKCSRAQADGSPPKTRKTIRNV